MLISYQLAAYPHLYSFTSTKSIVHWFQIIRNKCFQMYDDDVQAPLSISASDRYYKVARFPTRNIKTPIVLVYGGSDSLVDIHVMLKELPRHTVAQEIPHYEHLDFLWGSEVDTLVFPHIFEALDTYTKHHHSNQSPYQLLDFRPRSSATVDGSTYSDDDQSSTDPTSASIDGLGERKDKSSGSYSSSKRYASATTNSQHRKNIHKRNTSNSSLRSTDNNKRVGGGGISVGTSRATTSVIDAASPPSSRRQGQGRFNNRSPTKKP